MNHKSAWTILLLAAACASVFGGSACSGGKKPVVTPTPGEPTNCQVVARRVRTRTREDDLRALLEESERTGRELLASGF